MDFDNCFFVYSDEDMPTDDNEHTKKKKKKHKKDKKDTTPSGKRYVH